MIQKQLPAGVHNISNESKCEIFRTDHISGCFLTYIRYIIFFGHWRYSCYIQFVYRAGDTGGQRKKKKKLREKRKSFRTVEMKKVMGGGEGGWAFIKKY